MVEGLVVNGSFYRIQYPKKYFNLQNFQIDQPNRRPPLPVNETLHDDFQTLSSPEDVFSICACKVTTPRADLKTEAFPFSITGGLFPNK